MQGSFKILKTSSSPILHRCAERWWQSTPKSQAGRQGAIPFDLKVCFSNDLIGKPHVL